MGGACPTRTIGLRSSSLERTSVVAAAAAQEARRGARAGALSKMTSATTATERGTGQPTAVKNRSQKVERSEKAAASTAVRKDTSGWTVPTRETSLAAVVVVETDAENLIHVAAHPPAAVQGPQSRDHRSATTGGRAGRGRAATSAPPRRVTAATPRSRRSAAAVVTKLIKVIGSGREIGVMSARSQPGKKTRPAPARKTPSSQRHHPVKSLDGPSRDNATSRAKKRRYEGAPRR